MSNKTLIEWNADVGTRFLTIHPDGSFDIDKDAPPLFVIGELAKAFIRQQDRIKRLEEELTDTKNKHAVLVADVVLDEDRAERIKRLEKALTEIELAMKQPAANHMMQIAGPARQVINIIKKAKEAKL